MQQKIWKISEIFTQIMLYRYQTILFYQTQFGAIVPLKIVQAGINVETRWYHAGDASNSLCTYKVNIYVTYIYMDIFFSASTDTCSEEENLYPI